MSTTYAFSNNQNFKAQYVSRPGTGGYGGILTFSIVKGDSTSGADVKYVDTALLCNSAQVEFAREVQQSYFLNVNGIGYILGRGTGTLSLSGMLGNAEDFAKLFGNETKNPCDGIYTVKLDAFGMMPCNSTDSNARCIIMNGVIPRGFSISTQIQEQTGAMYYTANASFLISGLGVTGARSSAKSFLKSLD